MWKTIKFRRDKKERENKNNLLKWKKFQNAKKWMKNNSRRNKYALHLRL